MSQENHLTTGFIDTSILSGPMAVELKFAGLDHLVIRGKAPYPVFLRIHNGKIEIQDASWVWGLGPERTKMEIQDFLGDEEVQVISIDWTGEKMFQFEQFEGGMLWNNAKLQGKIAGSNAVGIKKRYPGEA